MITKDQLEMAANITAIFTFFGAVGAWCHYQRGLIRRRIVLEECLKKEGRQYKENNKPGEFNFTFIIAHTGMTESEIIQASFRSKRVIRRETTDSEGYATGILFRYRD